MKIHPFVGSARVASVLLVTVAAMSLLGCRESDALSNLHAVHLSDPDKRHATHFRRKNEAMLVEIPRGNGGLGRRQKSDVVQFLARYKAESDGQLVISSPREMRNHLSARAAIRDMRDVIRDAGLDERAVAAVRHSFDRRNGNVLVLSYRRPVAVPPRCGNWPEDLGVNRERVPYQDFGCATRRNIAITVHNGRDLLGPHPTDPRSSERRARDWREYIGSSNSPAASSSVDPAVKTTR